MSISISQLYGEILGNVTGVTFQESDVLNEWYLGALYAKPDPGLAMRVAYIYVRRTMDYRDHIVQGILDSSLLGK